MNSVFDLRPESPIFNTSRSNSPTNTQHSKSFTIEEYLRSGDFESIKVLLSTTPILELNISENLIIDCSKGLNELNKNKMSIYGSILRNRFKAWRYIVERLNRDLSLNELESIIIVANSNYKDINWSHPFWKNISLNSSLNNYAKKWIQYRTN